MLGVLFIAGCRPSTSDTTAAPAPAEAIASAVPALALQPSPLAGVSGRLMFHSDREGRHKLVLHLAIGTSYPMARTAIYLLPVALVFLVSAGAVLRAFLKTAQSCAKAGSKPFPADFRPIPHTKNVLV